MLAELDKRFSEINTRVKTISSMPKFIEDTAEQMKKDMELRLGSITRSIRGVAPSVPGEPGGTSPVKP
ncbi:MAG: hypothetical protein HY673_07715 [Chloroflexi bacterium]|nr:hypothetical protein [Chloroflexota bacterium]